MARLPIEWSSPTRVRMSGRDYLAFAGCNYLGLGSHPAVVEALTQAARSMGISTTASRETTGNSLSHEGLERELAAFMGQEAAILGAEGYTANFMALQTLALTHRVAIIDSHAHRSLRHAAVAAGLHVCEYEHLSSRSARWLATQHADSGVVILTDSVFAADGAVAPLADLLAVLPPHRSTLLVDDCHGFCVLGRGGRGAVEAAGLTDPRVVITTTLAKGLGCYGGAVLGRKAFIESVQQHAWVYRSSTPVPPAIAEACRAAIRVLARNDEWVAKLRGNIQVMREVLFFTGLGMPPDGVPIFTFAVSDEARQQRVHEMLLEQGVFAPLIEYPGGPTSRYFRVVVNAMHTHDEINTLGKHLIRALDKTRDERPARRPRPPVEDQELPDVTVLSKQVLEQLTGM